MKLKTPTKTFINKKVYKGELDICTKIVSVYTKN